MYPRIVDFTLQLGGLELPIVVYSFGLMVAVAIIVASWLTGRELDRLYRQGRIDPVRVPVRDDENGRKGGMRAGRPSELVGTMGLLAAGAGIVGAKIFHILENPGDFILNPAGMLFSTGGLTFYGGLIVGGGALVYYVRKKGIGLGLFADATAPGLMLAYGIGRIGCHLAGDGDWGIQANMGLKPDWLPTWLWAETYPNNILRVDLPDPGVYPTSLYEFAAAVLIFGILWLLRKHPFKGGWLFSLYLLLSGIERFLIEQIRVNNEFTTLGITYTQAELISTILVVVGLVGLVNFTSKELNNSVPESTASGA